jgi:hypothetical protein
LTKNGFNKINFENIGDREGLKITFFGNIKDTTPELLEKEIKAYGSYAIKKVSFYSQK